MSMEIDTKALVAAVGDAIVVCDTQGRITLWNAAAEYMFGYSPAEAMGQSLDIIIPERLRKRHWEGYEKTMATGITRYGHDVLRVPAIDKTGTAMSIAFTVALLFDSAGKVDQIVSVIRNETARFNEDRALRKRVMELEAQLAASAAAQSGTSATFTAQPAASATPPAAG
jgi:PAS domain S-box-containing protein